MHIVLLLAALGLQVFLSVKKMSPFLSLLIVAILAGLSMGLSPAKLMHAIQTGTETTLGGTVFIFCLGAALGKVLEKNGAIQCMADTLIKVTGKKYIAWAVMFTAFLVGIPLFYNAGFILLLPLVFSLAAETGLPRLYLAIPMAAALSVTHCFLPPHPGPVMLINALHADLGKTLVYGLCIAIPVVIMAGPLLAQKIRQLKTDPMELFTTDQTNRISPPAPLSFFFALLPVLFITIAVIINQNKIPDSVFTRIFLFTGDPVIALLIALLSVLCYTAVAQKKSMTQLMNWVQEAMSGIIMILLIITAGGVFKEVITVTGTAAEIAAWAGNWNMNPIVFAWGITALLRLMLGSATVAGITAAGLVAPLLVHGYPHPELLVLAVGTGSVFGSHVNDSGFWMFKEFFKLSLKQTFLSWTLMESLISVLGLIGVLLLSMVVQ